MSGSDKLVIEVNPNIGSNPQVKLDERNAKGKKKIRWVKKSGCDDFSFVALLPHTKGKMNPFKKIKVNKNRVKCRFDPDVTAASDEKFEYTVYIDDGGSIYDSDEDEGPNNGRAVIRN